jgi:bifunctional non-homologous end joining protein LigD
MGTCHVHRSVEEGRPRAADAMSLETYRKKRNFAVTPEPSGAKRRSAIGKRLRYVVQMHQASHLHYDFRLEWNGVLLSWAVPKGPSLDPAVKRLGMRVEDHPLDYAGFEGVIPKGEYGAGTVMVWDKGTWVPDDPDVDAALRRGDLKFTLHGEKLQGSWVLVRTKSGYPPSSGRPAWLLIKHRDEFASTQDVEAAMPRSASTSRTLTEIARDEGDGEAQPATPDARPARRAAGASRPASRGQARKPRR